MSNKKLIWVDKEFERELVKLKGRKLMNGDSKVSIPRITNELIKTPSFNNCINEILNKQNDDVEYAKLRFKKR